MREDSSRATVGVFNMGALVAVAKGIDEEGL
jgi:hypothetical protein